MKFIPSLFILGTLATSTAILSGCGGGSSSGGIKQPQINSAQFTFTNIDAPAGDDALAPFSIAGPFQVGGGVISRFENGALTVQAYKFDDDTHYRYFSFYRTVDTPNSPPVGTTYDLTDEGPYRLTYFVHNDVDGYVYGVPSGKATIVAKKGSFVTLRFKNLLLHHEYRGEIYNIRFNGTLTYDESQINALPTGVKLPKN